MGRRNLILAVAAAVLLAAALIAASVVSGGGGGGDAAQPSTSTGSVSTSAAGPVAKVKTAALATLKGVPRHGTILGRPNAPVTLIEYADFQCPYCARFAEQTLPTLVRSWVRTGKVKIEFRGLAFLGPDSGKALRFAVAAQQKGRFWEVVELLYANQGSENAGWVTDSLLRGVARAAGLDPAATLAAANALPASSLAALNAAGEHDGVSGTPFFLVARQGGTPVQIGVGALTADAFTPAFDAALTE